MKRKKIYFAIMLFLGAFLFSACAKNVNESSNINKNKNANANRNANANINTNSNLNTQSPQPDLNINDQPIVNGRIKINKVRAISPSWIVVHSNDNGNPGTEIGKTIIPAGEKENIYIEIDSSKATRDVFVILHDDKGQAGKFEFPGPDAITQANGSPAIEKITLISEAGAEGEKS